MSEVQSTHSENCWALGPKHYGCAAVEISRLRTALTQSQAREKRMREVAGELLSVIPTNDPLYAKQLEKSASNMRAALDTGESITPPTAETEER